MNNIVKKITTVSLFTLLSFNVSATELKLPQKSILNNSNNALQLPEELRYFMQNGINAKGIISSTILTLLVLPALYKWFPSRFSIIRGKKGES